MHLKERVAYFRRSLDEVTRASRPCPPRRGYPHDERGPADDARGFFSRVFSGNLEGENETAIYSDEEFGVRETEEEAVSRGDSPWSGLPRS